MGFFKRNKKKAASAEALKWDKMWQLWANGQVDPPYDQLMTYQSEVNNGGHSQFFYNAEDTGDLDDVVREVLSILPEELAQNLQTGHDAFKKYKDADDDCMDEVLDNCDDVFYENEEAINALLREFADRLEL